MVSATSAHAIGDGSSNHPVTERTALLALQEPPLIAASNITESTANGFGTDGNAKHDRAQIAILPGISSSSIGHGSAGGGSGEDDEAGDDDDDDDDDDPLPRLQVVLLCGFARMVEPLAFFSIFPFINQMIKESGDILEEDVGFYSGLIESLFSLTQMSVMIFWGRASDRVGRKPILLLSLIGVSICMTLFGFSTHIWQMILFRCLAGVFAGTIITVRTMIAEISTPKNQAAAFSYFAFAGNLGILIGPIIGGSLSNLADHNPKYFYSFFKAFPYATPMIIIGLFGMTAVLLCAIFLKETLGTHDTNKTATHAPMSTWEVITAPGVLNVLLIYSHLSLIALAFTAVLPVFCFTQAQMGGYGFTPAQISLFMAVGGLSQSLWTLLVFPPLQRRIGTGGILRLVFVFGPISYMSFPLNNFLLRHQFMSAFWVLVFIGPLCGGIVSMSFSAIQLAINDISPTPNSLGTLSGISLTILCAERTVAPALFTAIFAIGVKHHIMSGYLVWVVFTVMALGLNFLVRFLPKKAEGRIWRRRDGGDE